ncbi:MAG: type II secretion system protein PulP, partial [Deltaproteobacteria bacterium]
EVQPAPPPPPPPTALQVFIMTVRALGFVEKEKDKTVFLSKNDELFIAKSGDLVDGRFRILSITETALKVRDEVTKEESVIAIAVQ